MGDPRASVPEQISQRVSYFSLWGGGGGRAGLGVGGLVPEALAVSQKGSGGRASVRGNRW